MTNPRFHAFEAKRNLPFYSTGSLAIGSIIVACCAIIMLIMMIAKEKSCICMMTNSMKIAITVTRTVRSLV